MGLGDGALLARPPSELEPEPCSALARGHPGQPTPTPWSRATRSHTAGWANRSVSIEPRSCDGWHLESGLGLICGYRHLAPLLSEQRRPNHIVLGLERVEFDVARALEIE